MFFFFFYFFPWQKDCICVPHSSTIFAQVIQSELVWNWHKLQPIKIPGCSDIIPPREMDTCAGAASVHDLQLSQVSPDKFTAITEPLKMIDFNFTKGDFDEERTTVSGARTINEGHCHGLFMWWELIMDTEGEVRLSTAPTWAHPDRDKAQWRDHWMQAVYFFDRPLYTKKGKICCCVWENMSCQGLTFENLHLKKQKAVVFTYM